MTALVVAVVCALGAVFPAAPGSLEGRASWYDHADVTAAAGPELRRWLGKGWRGTTVRVSANGRSVVVRLDDWCQCYKGESRERLIDLSDEAFRQLAPLPVGVLQVRIERVGSEIVPPATDTMP
jgi:hypothetical protein